MGNERYPAYLALTSPDEQEYERQRTETFSGPLFSVLAVGEGKDLEPSVTQQTYAHAEYIDTCGDLFSAAGEARGEFLLPLPKDSALTPDALYRFAKACGGADLVYADEDALSHDGTRVSPRFKPDFAPETLLAHPYIGLPFAVSVDWFKRRAKRELLDGHDLTEFTLYAAMTANSVRHIPRVLLSRRTRLPLLDAAPVARTLRRLGRSAVVSDGQFAGSFRVRYAYAPKTRVTVAVWNRYPYPVLKKTLETIEQASIFDMYDLLILNTVDSDPTLDAYLDGLQRNRAARVLRLPPDTAPAVVWNDAAAEADDPYVLFLDAAFLPDGYHEIESLLELCTQDGVGAVGGRLRDQSGALLSSGMVVGLNGGVGTPYRHAANSSDPLQNMFTRMTRNVSCLPVCGMMIDRGAFFQTGQFDQTIGPEGFDLAFCLRLAEHRLRCVFTPYAGFSQHAALPAQPPLSSENDLRLMDVFRNLLVEGDPYFNPNWDYSGDAVRIALPPAPAIQLHQKGVWFP